MKMKANKTRNELKVLDSNTYRLKTEERMKNGEEQRKMFTNLLTETSQKCYGSTSAWNFFTETHVFHPKQLKCIAQGSGINLHSPLPLFIAKMGSFLLPRGFLRTISERTPITKFTPTFRTLRKSYESLTEVFKT